MIVLQTFPIDEVLQLTLRKYFQKYVKHIPVCMLQADCSYN